jgi:DNA end-binding protein Ku
MARSIWSGVVSFGLVSVPVALYSATREHEVTFHQFEKGTTDRIRNKRVNERTGKVVDYGDVVKGAEVNGGRYVMLEQSELEAVAPGRSRSLDIHVFVDLDEIDPIYFQKSYYLAPGSDETVKTYALLRDAMADANRAAIGTLVMRGKQYLATIRPRDDLLVLETMYFDDEIREPKEELPRVPGRAKLSAQELDMAGKLIESMSGAFKPNEFRDSYADRVQELIKAKGKGVEVTEAEEAPEATNVIDIMDALRASVDAARQRRTGGTSRTARRSAPAGKKSAPAKKSPPAKKSAPAGKKSAPAKKSVPAKKSGAPKKSTAAKKAAPAKKSTTSKRSTSAKKTTKRAA